jgi:hypothetical protein
MSGHIVTSAALAAGLYAVTRSWAISAACLLSGVLIDLDHLVDFYLFSGERFSVKTFFSWCLDTRWQRVAVFLHSYELYAIACVVAYIAPTSVLHGALWGVGLHLLLDQTVNGWKYRLSPWFYLLSYRIAVRFRRERLLLS